MAGGFPLDVNGVRIPTAEALYQACRFPHFPDLQQKIIGQRSPIAAKAVSRANRRLTRADWEQVKVDVMRWCLRVKLAQNWERFAPLLLETGDKPIVEFSRRDDFWGAKPQANGLLVGRNVLGNLLMELREEVRSMGKKAFKVVKPPNIPDCLLLGKSIEPVYLNEENPRVGEQYPLF